MKHDYIQYTWYVNEVSHEEHWLPVRLGWVVGKKIALFRKSYGSGIWFKPRKWIVVFLTAFIEANLETR